MNPSVNSLLTFKRVFLFGLLLCVGISLYLAAFDKQYNFFVFKLATLDFWNGVSPYGAEWFRHGYDYYLYSPVFNFLFTPFAFLPQPLDVLVWNLFNYVLFAYAIYSFPHTTGAQKSRTLLFLLPVLGVSLLFCQYNIAVAALFILAFSLLENNRPVWAILLIVVSGLTKVYGLAELSLLVFYPRLWRNVGWAVVLGVAVAALPLVRWGAAYGDLLGQWVEALGQHNVERRWETVFDLRAIPWHGMRQTLTPLIQVGVFAVLAALVLARRALWAQFSFRIGVVGLVMGWCILFGSASETHTYLISLLGLLLWYRTLSDRPRLLRVVYWTVFVVVAVLPLDFVCPPAVMDFVYHTLDVNKWLMLFVWVYMAVWVFDRRRYDDLAG